ncbi:efflux RND transporter periplasmic adaptor subunit [Rhodoblastus acidophilus]|uniref:Efflux RND transporter periplasmic adaptor subunit n=1 Tax=Candidatus Rhodoblastus alkanivorans TaxID=2954117 RepID=A0ABS9Z3X9_9HYPH|nr:efflux RND transporter periplasmic adaptor subunit [Candidatus Rhodoblastus alkanivorans]MCI4680191.1 efflux RND transporter periplasmic adaptor subunit [Candidatus Rhodoblastus alkanivorans]MCI4682287.1 efflux RND transporter periplasmic adaptor subunit [Candidatus Rhodoblastus alkanivorans]MDI4639589.1 efflux RND transporter periplasmic adaptor subunit [Rhodoblastus acidophilus]
MLSLLLKTLPILLAAVLGGLVAIWLGGHGPSDESPAPSAYAPLSVVSVPMVEATPMETASRYKLGGVVEAREIVHLTAQQPGRVAFIAGQEGERVDAGAVVVALDDAALKPEYRSAWAALGGDMAAQQNAQTQLYQKLYGPRQPAMGGPGYDAYERTFTPFYNMFQNFMGSNVPGTGSPPMMTQGQAQTSPSAVNNARADYERQQAALVAAQSRLDSLDQRLRDRRSIAPFAAVIMTRHVRVGDVVQPGQPLVDLADPDQLDLRIEAPADLALNVKIGDKLPVSLDRGNVWAVVSQIFPGADQTSHTVTIKAALPPGVAAAPGMYGLAWIPQPGGGGEQAVAPGIPRSAIVYRGSLPAAFIVSADGTAEMRILRLGDSMGDRIAVLSGLSIGDKVVAHPASDLKSGDPLTTLRR